jgi:hypothetical protein
VIDQVSHSENFITRWQASGAVERANYVSFLNGVRAVEELLQTLAALGQAREVEAGRYVA